MKKIFTFLVAFLTTVSGAVWGQLGSPDNYYDIAQLQKVLEIDDSEEYYLTGSNNYGIRIVDGDPTVYLKNVQLGSSDKPFGGSAIIVNNFREPKFIIEGENAIYSNGETPAIRVGHVNGSATEVGITIEGTGILNIVMSDDNGIAIGNCQVGGAMGPCGSEL